MSRNVRDTRRLVPQLSTVTMENARPVIPAGKISLNNNQDTVEENRISIKLLSYLLLLFRNETLCTTFLTKKYFICTKMNELVKNILTRMLSKFVKLFNGLSMILKRNISLSQDKQ